MPSPRAPRPRPRLPAPVCPRYERLTAWQATDDLTRALYRETFTWADGVDDPLADEIRKSATAAVTYIMLGSAEPDRAGFRRALDVALGKLVRLAEVLVTAKEAGWLANGTWGELEARRDHAEQLVRGLWRALGRGGK